MVKGELPSSELGLDLGDVLLRCHLRLRQQAPGTISHRRADQPRRVQGGNDNYVVSVNRGRVEKVRTWTGVCWMPTPALPAACGAVAGFLRSRAAFSSWLTQLPILLHLSKSSHLTAGGGDVSATKIGIQKDACVQ